MTGAERLLRPSLEEALAAYRAQVLANRAYIDALEGERPPGHDYWATRAPGFRPGRAPLPELGPLLELAQPGDTWLDIGAGGGRFAVPLAEHAAKVVAIEPSPSMRAQLAEAAREAGRENIEIVDLTWPPADGAGAPEGDIALAANVLYAIDDVGGFLAAMERQTRRTCAVVAFDRAPNTPLPGLWRDLWGSEFRELPALREIVAVLLAMGRRVRVAPLPPTPLEPKPVDAIANEYAWMYHVRPGIADYEAKLARFRELVAKHCGAGGGLAVPPLVRRYSSVISWPVER
ncbi:methyltransferase [Tepidiforma sp.]|uniref:class I SAM-dependent methyltransferase n=1 Tax=Tepidiforma sp. TaxID=2682230 RepID=UPI0026055247|nr:methyltransferase [Tepidiforma sp.]MCX7616718.1 class I SAM-dependent methyltransferase [Tepidiforma sp.]